MPHNFKTVVYVNEIILHKMSLSWVQLFVFMKICDITFPRFLRLFRQICLCICCCLCVSCYLLLVKCIVIIPKCRDTCDCYAGNDVVLSQLGLNWICLKWTRSLHNANWFLRLVVWAYVALWCAPYTVYNKVASSSLCCCVICQLYVCKHNLYSCSLQY